MNRTLELPEPVYEALVEAARASGLTPIDWIASKLPGGGAVGRDRGAGIDRLELPASLERAGRASGSPAIACPSSTSSMRSSTRSPSTG